MQSETVERLSRPLSCRLKRVLLHLAHGTGFPLGSEEHGYEFIAPLDADGRLDLQLWETQRDRCRVVRFWTGVPRLPGLLMHRRSGEDEESWFFDFDKMTTDDDEFGYRLDRRMFVPGGYVSLHDTSNVHKFHIVSVSDL